MAAKGAQAKVNITNKILETFPGSFTYEKEIRIPYTEDGAEGQIKVVLTAAKQMIDNQTSVFNFNTDKNVTSNITRTPNDPIEPTEEEKERLQKLLNKLGIE